MTKEEEAIEQLKHMKVFIGYDAENYLVKKMQSALDMGIKAIEQQPKIGKWIKTSVSQVSGGDFNRGVKCSCCSYVTVVDDFNYCPNCGARMTESEDETPRNNLAESSQDCISRQEALKYSHIEYDDDGIGHRVIYAEDIEKLSPVTPSYNSINTELKPCEDVLDEIITQIEQMRDKDKIAEYPYNRCIRIVEGYKNGE